MIASAAMWAALAQAAPPVLAMPEPQYAPARATVIDVQAARAGEVLWQGQLTLWPGAGAGYSHQNQEAVACLSSDGGVRPLEANSRLNVNLDEGRGELLAVGVEWTRPRSGVFLSCSSTSVDALATRVQTELELPRNKPVTLSGDGDLTLTLTRR